ncbi:CvpA family protein [Thermomicrobium sp. 4228-Ro]|uniref:CvpA family protein n=1 Tax=Thermomicrobium sp. 4228-Ro TaxID=2993937 RepID=UPI002248C1B4|nr:CvpA family protein [Thermomicrobium sp. 4228-Ro]MCX2727044.1 CvpA family protein [Thermomicrobium sp. 4228-Ro]
MRTVTLYLVLDILLLVLLALFVPIGFWRGASREVLVTLGILLGFALGEFWAQPWGLSLSEWTGLGEGAASFLTAVLILVACTFLIGYGASAVMLVPQPGLAGRLLGALIAFANGTLLLGFALRAIRLYLLGGAPSGLFERSIIARLLSESMPWVLLGGAVLALPIIVVTALLGSHAVEAEIASPSGEGEFAYQHTPTRPLPPRAPFAQRQPAVTYKAEPIRRHEEPTRPLRPTEMGADAGEHRAAGLADRETAVLARPESPGQSRPTGNRCPYCHADISEAEVFCPRCGRVL